MLDICPGHVTPHTYAFCVWLFCTTNNVEQLLMPRVGGTLLLSQAYPLHSLSAAVEYWEYYEIYKL